MAFENAVRLQEINEEMERLQNEAKSVRAQLVDESLVAMKEYGITLADLGQHQNKRRGDVKPAKYANPFGEGCLLYTSPSPRDVVQSRFAACWL